MANRQRTSAQLLFREEDTRRLPTIFYEFKQANYGPYVSIIQVAIDMKDQAHGGLKILNG